MRKVKLTFVILMLVLAALIVPSAFGAEDNQPSQIGESNSTNSNNADPYFNQMFDWQNSQLDQAVKNGQTTPEQSQAWQEHFNYMRNFNHQYGMGMGGGCYGYGMMSGYGGYPAPNFQQQ